MRPLIGILASAPAIAGRMRFFAASILSRRDAAGSRRWPRARPRCRRGRPAPSRRSGGRPLRTRATTRCRTDGSRRPRRNRARVEFAPFARRHHRPGGEAHRLEQHADADRIGREHLAEQRDGRPARSCRRAAPAPDPARLRSRAYCSIAPASTSLASAWVGTPKPGTSMPMMRTPLISFGSSCSGTPEAVGTQRLMITIAS